MTPEKKIIIHRAKSRGFADHGWLKSFHTFSFAGYFNPDRMHFGALRVLNDDTVDAAMGFGTHPHDNMEIVSIPLEGDLEHKDSMGNTTVIRKGDIQLMSAGTGVSHSEYNHSKEKPVKFLQIWVFPKEKNVSPRYDQMTLNANDRHNRLQQIISPDKSDAGLWMNQDAWFQLGKFDAGKSAVYRLHSPGNGVYAFVLSGAGVVAGEKLEERDGCGITGVEEITIEAATGMELLLMEVPMQR
jgi:quercetin 2,3-dioxygenase